jgi:hypothetical protein
MTFLAWPAQSQSLLEIGSSDYQHFIILTLNFINNSSIYILANFNKGDTRAILGRGEIGGILLRRGYLGKWGIRTVFVWGTVKVADIALVILDVSE